MTKSGKPCRRWDSLENNSDNVYLGDPSQLITPRKYPKWKLNGSFCRNPGITRNTIWCYTYDKAVPYEECNVIPISQEVESCNHKIKNCALCQQVAPFECKVCIKGYIRNTYKTDSGETKTECIY